jgi:hypothetical protein
VAVRSIGNPLWNDGARVRARALEEIKQALAEVVRSWGIVPVVDQLSG